MYLANCLRDGWYAGYTRGSKWDHHTCHHFIPSINQILLCYFVSAFMCDSRGLLLAVVKRARILCDMVAALRELVLNGSSLFCFCIPTLVLYARIAPSFYGLYYGLWSNFKTLWSCLPTIFVVMLPMAECRVFDYCDPRKLFYSWHYNSLEVVWRCPISLGALIIGVLHFQPWFEYLAQIQTEFIVWWTCFIFIICINHSPTQPVNHCRSALYHYQ